MSSPIELLVKETKAAFVIAKSDGNLDASEVIQIAVALSQKVQKLASLSGNEKKSLLLLTLKKGLDTSGGVGSLPGFADASAEVKAAFEESLLNAASAAIDAIILAASGKLDLKKPANWLACLPACLSAVNVMLPKDQVQLKEAVEFAEKILHKTTDPSNVGAVVKAAAESVVSTEVTKVVSEVAAVASSVADSTVVVEVKEVVMGALPGVAEEKK